MIKRETVKRVMFFSLTLFFFFGGTSQGKVVAVIENGKVVYKTVKEGLDNVQQKIDQIQQLPQQTYDQTVGQAVGQVQSQVDQYAQQINDYYNQVVQVQSQVQQTIGQVGNILNSVQNIANALHINIPLGGITSALGKIQQAISSLSGVFSVYGKVQSVFDKIDDYFEKIKQFKVPPDFVWKVPQVVVFKKKKVQIQTPENKPLSNSNLPIPYEELTKICKKNPTAYRECATLLSGKTIDYYGQTIGEKVAKKDTQEIGKQIEKEAETLSVSSATPELSGEALINARIKYLDVSTSPEKVLLPESLERIPKPLRDKFKGLLAKQYFRMTYIKTLQARIKLHYSKLVKLKALVDQLCSVKTDTLSSLENCQTVGLSSFFKGRGIKGKVKGESLPLETKGACCGVCWKALSQARVNAHLITKGFLETNLNIEKAKSEIVSVISAQECAVRNTIKTEVSALRDENKAFACLQAKLMLENLMLKIDQLEAQTAIASSLFALLQNQEDKKLDELLSDLRKQGIVP